MARARMYAEVVQVEDDAEPAFKSQKLTFERRREADSITSTHSQESTTSQDTDDNNKDTA